MTAVDLETDRRYAGLVTVVPKLGVRGALSVPVAVGGRPVGALSVYATRRVRGRRLTSLRWAPTRGSSPSCWQPAWRLAPRDAEVAELTQALTARVWVEQAKGALMATEGLDQAAASQRPRARAGASQRSLADVAREVVQDAQRDRTAVIAAERVRSRAAEARAEHAEAALEAAKAEPRSTESEMRW